MTCADFESLLDDQFAPAQLHEHPQLAEHAVACTLCRTRWDGQRLLAECIPAWREQIPDVDLTAAVLAAHESLLPTVVAQNSSHALSGIPAATRSTAEIRRAAPRTELDQKRRSFVAGAVALTALVAVVVLAPRGDHSRSSGVAVRSPQSSAEKSIAVSTPRDTSTTIASSDAGSAEPALADDRSPYSGLAQLAAGAWNEVSLLVQPESDHSPRTTGSSTDGKQDWIDGLQHQLKPIGRSLDNAFDFLWQAGQASGG